MGVGGYYYFMAVDFQFCKMKELWRGMVMMLVQHNELFNTTELHA